MTFKKSFILCLFLVLPSLVFADYKDLVQQSKNEFEKKNYVSGFEKMVSAVQSYLAIEGNKSKSALEVGNDFKQCGAEIYYDEKYDYSSLSMEISDPLAEMKGRLINIVYRGNYFLSNSMWILYAKGGTWFKYKLLENHDRTDELCYISSRAYWKFFDSPLVIIMYSNFGGNWCTPAIRVYQLTKNVWSETYSYDLRVEGGAEFKVDETSMLPKIILNTFEWKNGLPFFESHAGPHLVEQAIMKFQRSKGYVFEKDPALVPSPYATLWLFIDSLQNSNVKTAKKLVSNEEILHYALEQKMNSKTEWIVNDGDDGRNNADWIEFATMYRDKKERKYNVYKAEFIKIKDQWIIKAIYSIK